jgi:hypothetical protein
MLRGGADVEVRKHPKAPIRNWPVSGDTGIVGEYLGEKAGEVGREGRGGRAWRLGQSYELRSRHARSAIKLQSVKYSQICCRQAMIS